MSAIESLVGWVPICRLDDHATLGVLDGRMSVERGLDRQHVSADDLLGLLPLLEQPFTDFLAVLDEREAELDLQPGSLRQWLPWPAVVRVASLSPSDYWANLALRWIEEVPAEDRDEVTLLNLGTGRHFPQSLRHRALRMLRSDGTPGR